eukprot:217556_1
MMHRVAYISDIGRQSQFTEYSIDLNTFEPPEAIAFSVSLWSYQFWTQQQDIVYLIMNSPRSLVAFDVATHSYLVSFPSLPQDPGAYSCLDPWQNSAALVQSLIYARAASCGDTLFVIGAWSERVWSGGYCTIIDPISQTIYR